MVLNVLFRTVCISANLYLSVHTEIDIRAEPIASQQLAGVDSFTGEGIDDLCDWKKCREVTGGAPAGAT